MKPKIRQKMVVEMAIAQKSVNIQMATVDAVFSTASVDRHGEIIMQNFELANFLRNPVVLNSHRYGDATETIGKVIKAMVVNGRLEGTIQFAVKENPKAKIIFDLYAGGFLNAFSVGIMPLELDDVGNIVRSEMLEISAVAVPANAEALVRSKGIDLDALGLKTVVPTHDTPKADEGQAWDAAAAVARVKAWASSDGSGADDKIDFDLFKYAFAWFDEADKENPAAYKLPHHDIINDELTAILKGVEAAMANVADAGIPEADRAGVVAHLEDHLTLWEKEPPADEEKKSAAASVTKDVAETVALANIVDYLAFLIRAFGQAGVDKAVVEKMNTALSILMEVLRAEAVIGVKGITAPVTKEGRVLSGANREIIANAIAQMKEAVTALNELMSATEAEKKSAAPATPPAPTARPVTVLEQINDAIETIKRAGEPSKVETRQAESSDVRANNVRLINRAVRNLLDMKKSNQ